MVVHGGKGGGKGGAKGKGGGKGMWVLWDWMSSLATPGFLVCCRRRRLSHEINVASGKGKGKGGGKGKRGPPPPRPPPPPPAIRSASQLSIAHSSVLLDAAECTMKELCRKLTTMCQQHGRGCQLDVLMVCGNDGNEILMLPPDTSQLPLTMHYTLTCSQDKFDGEDVVDILCGIALDGVYAEHIRLALEALASKALPSHLGTLTAACWQVGHSDAAVREQAFETMKCIAQKTDRNFVHSMLDGWWGPDLRVQHLKLELEAVLGRDEAK